MSEPDPTHKEHLQFHQGLIGAIYENYIVKQLQASIGPYNRTDEEKEEIRQRNEERKAKRHRLRAAYLTIDDPVAKLHAPEGDGMFMYDCHGCDSGTYAEDYPEWPCRTADIMIAKYLGDSYV